MTLLLEEEKQEAIFVTSLNKSNNIKDCLLCWILMNRYRDF